MPLLGSFIVPHPPIIVAEIGKGEETKATKTIESYHQIAKKISELKPKTIVVISPHATSYSDCFSLSPKPSFQGTFSRFNAREIRFSGDNDLELTKIIIEEARLHDIDIYSTPSNCEELDHGVMVPLYFINQYYQDYQLVRIPLSGLPFRTHYQLGVCIQKAVNRLNKDVVIIASGDLSHKLKVDGPYGFIKEGPIYDQLITKAMAKGDFYQLLTLDDNLWNQAADCGRKSYIIMAGAYDGQSVSSNLLSYEAPFGVGYALATFTPVSTDPTRELLTKYDVFEHQLMNTIRISEDVYVQLARKSLEYYLLNHKPMPIPTDIPEELTHSRAGVFVSLKIQNTLRGCIGTISAVYESIASEIIHNAISAGTKDPRFSPVKPDELNKIIYSVDVLGEAEPVHDIIDLDPITYGVIVRYGPKSGLLLPNLEGVDTVEDQLSIALRKAGIQPNSPYTIERFKVIRHH